MWLLWIITAVWAFSFSLIGEYLAGSVDSYIAVFIRVALAFLLFLPLLRPRSLPRARIAALTAIGALQLGVTYLLLYHSFLFLSVPEVLLFTVFTPLWVNLIDELLLNRRHLPARWWLAAALSVAGAAYIRYDGLGGNLLTGFLLIQGANLSFAAGQVAYKRLELGDVRRQAGVFGFFFLGAALTSGLGALLFADWNMIPRSALEWGVLAWLGLGASGLGYLGWNVATKWVNTGQLATMNNMLIPAGILVNVLIWNREADWTRLVVGGAVLMGAVWLCGAGVTDRRSQIADRKEDEMAEALAVTADGK